MSASKPLRMTSTCTTEAESRRFEKAGFAPVLRWVRIKVSSRLYRSHEVKEILAKEAKR